MSGGSLVADADVLVLLSSIDQHVQGVESWLSALVAVVLAAVFAYFAVRWFNG